MHSADISALYEAMFDRRAWDAQIEAPANSFGSRSLPRPFADPSDPLSPLSADVQPDTNYGVNASLAVTDKKRFNKSIITPAVVMANVCVLEAERNPVAKGESFSTYIEAH